MKAAVTGATGTVGRFIVAKLLNEGVAVRAWRRAGSDLTGLPEAIEWIEGDLAAPDTMPPLLRGADMLVHAALAHIPGRFRGGEGDDPAGFLRTNVDGSVALLRTAREAGVRRCVVLSSRAVFDGRHAPGRVPDEAAVQPESHYGAAKAALEAEARRLWAGEGWPIAILRPTGIYGAVAPVERSKWFDLVANVLRGDGIEARAGTEVHGGDVAESAWRLLTADPEMIAGRAFNCSDMVVSTRDLVELVQREAGVSGRLPKPSPEPPNIMDCSGLVRLGIRFSGRPCLERAVSELVAAVRTHQAADGSCYSGEPNAAKPGRSSAGAGETGRAAER